MVSANKNTPLPDQIVVLGGGLTSSGTPSQETYERAMSSVWYAEKYGAKRIIYSGGSSPLSEGDAISLSEGTAMANLAVSAGLNPDIVLTENESATSFHTFINIKDMLDTEEPAGIMSHAYHLPRALYMARMVLPMPIFGIEVMGLHTSKAKSPPNERLLICATKIILLGVKQGDIAKLRQRNELLDRMIGGKTRLSILKHTVLRHHTSVQASRVYEASEPADKNVTVFPDETILP